MKVIDKDKVLDEKRQMQKIFVRENGYESSVLVLLMKHYRGLK